MHNSVYYSTCFTTNASDYDRSTSNTAAPRTQTTCETGIAQQPMPRGSIRFASELHRCDNTDNGNSPRNGESQMKYRKNWDGPRVSAQFLLDQIPADGCLLVFNAPHRNFRSKVHGLLEVHAVDEPRGAGEARGNGLRDLYIHWKS